VSPPDANSIEPDALASLRDWLVGEGLEGASLSSLLEGFATRLRATGYPLSRAALASAAIHPDIRAFSLNWHPATGVIEDVVQHDAPSDGFERSPLGYMVAENLHRRRWRLSDDEACSRFPLLAELRAEGHTEYALQLVRFGGSATIAIPGVALSASTTQPDGFSRAQLDLLNGLTPLLALAAYRIGLFAMTVGLLDAYLGHDAGLRILNGQIRRGHGERLGAAILIADLRGFTAATESSGAELIGRLGEHLEAIAEPIRAAGGEVLKFLGDGLLAGFSTAGTDAPDKACAAALTAAIEGIARNEAVNARHPDTTALPLDIALHRGEVFYGNVGGGGRLDFTVIGPAVNEASRIEALCGVLDRPILMSSVFAACCGHPVVSLGLHRLRGVKQAREIFALAPQSPPAE
jgi:adenylate cyclase